MRRTLRRMIGVTMGLVLGWWAAGFLPGTLSAEPAKPDHQPPATQQDHAPAGNNHEAANADHGHGDAGLKAARELIPPREDVPWLRPVLLGVGGLFAAAVLIGIPLSRMKPAAAQDGHQASHATGGGHGQSGSHH